ncbi:Aste57867_5055 [Aphanomyces stellatus]|uniref:Aste57867_5055 protein n=1 Tax=Aphanomyces stellatus TaxID=120398 RepID=A0A485KH33_9STRA|nr:hypothetical protein As57867_005042 [Aphanomyces stellatus]VFT82136.1 Aste57867_5055 [Aphanomyces stellatus]
MVRSNVNSEHLEEIFGKFGGVAEVTMEVDTESKLSKGTAYIRFHKRDQAETAQLHMHEGQIDGNKVQVNFVLVQPKPKRSVSPKANPNANRRQPANRRAPSPFRPRRSRSPPGRRGPSPFRRRSRSPEVRGRGPSPYRRRYVIAIETFRHTGGVEAARRLHVLTVPEGVEARRRVARLLLTLEADDRVLARSIAAVHDLVRFRGPRPEHAVAVPPGQFFASDSFSAHANAQTAPVAQLESKQPQLESQPKPQAELMRLQNNVRVPFNCADDNCEKTCDPRTRCHKPYHVLKQNSIIIPSPMPRETIPNNAEAAAAKDTSESKDGKIDTLSPQDLSLGPVIGNGAFSTVFLATYHGEQVALKRQAIDAHILRELAILKQLDHPNLLRFIGSCEWEHEGSKEVWIVSELVQGGDVSKFLKGRKSNKASWAQIVQIALGAAEGLRYMHEQHIVHRDIKAANMLLDEHLNVRLCDFGFARTVADDNNHGDNLEEPEMAKRGRRMSLCGTDAYMPPEMLFEEDYNESIDIFSYGVVLIELICRQHINENGFLMRHPAKNFVIDMDEFRAAVPESCPPSLVLLAENCVSFESSGRPSAREVVEWLEDLKKDMQDNDDDASGSANNFALEMSTTLTDSLHDDDTRPSDVDASHDMDADSAPRYAGSLLMTRPSGGIGDVQLLRCVRRSRQRWVVLQDSTLTIYKNQKECDLFRETLTPRGATKPLSTSLAGALLREKKNRRWFVVLPGNTKWEFQATTTQDMQFWVAILGRAVHVADHMDARRRPSEDMVLPDPADEVYRWLDDVGMAHHYHTFKSKGFATLDFLRETGLGDDDFNFLNIDGARDRDVLAHAALVLRGEDACE